MSEGWLDCALACCWCTSPAFWGSLLGVQPAFQVADVSAIPEGRFFDVRVNLNVVDPVVLVLEAITDRGAPC